MPSVFILKNESNKNKVELINKNKLFKEYETIDLRLTETILRDIAERCTPGYFYIIKVNEATDSNLTFDFSFKPDSWDRKYVHVWDKDQLTIRLYNRDLVMKDPDKYTDDSLESGLINLKIMDEEIFTIPIYDIIYISYDELYAEENYLRLQKRFPRSKRIHNVKGIFEAHKSAAKLAYENNSEMFYVVDADAIVTNNFDFSFYPSTYDRNTIHLWHSHNPINGLEYGYGGIKLFPTKSLVEADKWGIDFTTTILKNLKIIPEVSNITSFNTDPYSTWKSAFRECAKLASKIIPNQNNDETLHRLNVWSTVGKDQLYGEFSLIGANEGKEFGELYKNDKEMLNQINNFEWLEIQFSS